MSQRPFHAPSLRSLVAAPLCALALLAVPAAAFAQAATTNEAAATAAAPAAQAAPDAGGTAAMRSAAPAARPAGQENPYGFKAMWEHGDMVSKGTLFILLIMSATSWYVIITKLLEQRRVHGQARLVQADFWNRGDLRASTQALPDSSVFRYVAEAGLIAQKQYEGPLTQQVDRNSWLSQSVMQAIDAVGDRLQGGLAVLATVGSTAPFVGLFGTVWGIYHALTAIGLAGQASIDKVAGPVGEALIMTAIGLAAAVPAVLGYNWLVRRNKAALDEVRDFGTELHTSLLGGKPAVTLGS
ncbi:biopolymer transporter ExbB [Paracidovorax avenae]|uniref:MotA/TolQ/ExbB proton channel family protein n=1 Tax=Paracidovorax avenae TaxID=80867 RepID=UPI000D16A8F6|nr:MotA/TolQ/ExbB proton channel family protein [Paracidovorax avenae]AVS81208.1 biopolymer transporter ExbB [Paracidovorax avenae]AVT16425.1 biopolymer transporter ExbB [Paracidovorax avenae]